MQVFAIISLVLASLWSALYVVTFILNWWERDGKGVISTAVGLLVGAVWLTTAILLL